ncbi:MAG: IS110 family transposase [Erysipelotrichaceae bacterium]|nr:IS110 family transposase [Erysipelotrichaceae bacterium]
MPVSTLYVGIDVSLKTNQVCPINFNQDVFFNEKFDNSPSGTEKMTIKILDVLRKNKDLNKVMFCMEATNVYHIHVSSSLASDPRLLAYGCKVYAENAKSIQKYKETFLDREKTDPEDAYLCADYARIGKCKKSHPVIGYQKIALQRLTRQRKHVAEQLGKEKQYLSSNLFLKFSALKVNPGDNPFSNTFGKTSSVMLTDFMSNEEIVEADLSDLIAKIFEVSRYRISDPKETARLLKKVARDSYRLDKVAADSISTAMASSFRLIQTYQEELKELDKEVLRLIQGYDNKYYQILTSIKGVGKVYAAGIIAEIDDIRYFKNDSKLAAYCGLRWKKNDSGDKRSDHTKQSNTCNAYLRYYIVEATGSILRFNDEYASYYHRKKSEVKVNSHKRALVLTSRKFVRLVYGMLRDNKLFDDHYLAHKS